MSVEELLSTIRSQAELLRFVRQAVHQAHHDGPITACPKVTCSAITKALGDAEGAVSSRGS